MDIYSNRGTSWSNTGSIYEGSSAGVTDILLLSSGRILAAIGYSGIPNNGFKPTYTDDYGENWTINIGSPVYTTPLPGSGQVFKQVELSDGVVVGVCNGNNDKVVRYTNYGLNASSLGITPSGFTPYTVVNAGNGRAIMGGSHGGSSAISLSINNGATWNAASSVSDADAILDIISLGDGILIACTGFSTGKIIKSTDYGENWSDLSQVDSCQLIYKLCYAGDGEVYGVTNDEFKVIKSIDSGDNWSVVSTITSDAYGLSCIASLGNGILLVGTMYDGYIYRSDDSGQTWNTVGDFLGETIIYDIEPIIDQNYVFVGTGDSGYVFKSIWEPQSEPEVIYEYTPASKWQSTAFQTKDTHLGNPNGDTVDNSAGADPTTVRKTQTMGQTGANVNRRTRSSGPLYTDGN